MPTYNQLLAIFREIAEAHLQIGQFGAGPIEDIPANVDYALMWVVYDPAAIDLSIRSDKVTFQVLFADLLHADKSNEHEVLSDQKQTACDVVAQLQLEAYHADFEVDDIVKLEPIVESVTADSIGGWQMTVTLRLDYLSNACEVPSTLSPDERPDCPAVTIVDALGNFMYTVAAGAVKTIADTTVKNSAATTIGTGRAENTITLPDKTLSNSDGSYASPIVQGIDKSLADITILEGDGENRAHPAGVDRTTSQRTFDFIITLKAGSVLLAAYQTANQGTVKSVALTNVSSYTVQRVRAGAITTVTLPFDVQQNDILQVSAVPANSSLDCVLAFTAYHGVVSNSLSLPASNGDGRYLFVLNYVDQTVSVIDTDSHTVIATTTLPSGKGFSSCLYRSANRTGWFFGNSYYAIMDCDPSSGTFCSILSHGALSINGLQAGCAYDYLKDKIYIGCTNNAAFKFNPDTLSLLNLGSYIGVTLARSQYMRYVDPLRAIYFGDESVGQMMISTENDLLSSSFVLGSLGQLQYCYPNGKLYHVASQQIIVRSSNPIRQLTAISNNDINRGDMIIIQDLDKIFAGSPFGNSLGIINTSTDSSIGSVGKSSPATNESGTRTILYSSYSERIYAQGMSASNQTTGVNRIHIFNPATNAYQSFITVGNMDAVNSHTFFGHQMFLNELIF